MAKIQPINRLRGFKDLLPEDSEAWDFVLGTAEEVFASAGFEKTEVPIVEKSDLFIRSIGEDTDTAGKEMYVFDTSKMGGKGKKKERGDDDLLALRPEFTAGMARSFIENGMQVWPKPISLYTYGPCFRHDNPQAGRYRQLTQFDAEIYGEEDPTIDAHIIAALNYVFEKIKVPVDLNINSIGCVECRVKIKKDLTEFFKRKESKLCEDCKKRLKKNPFRILDCKNEKCQSIVSTAPITIDSICEKCKVHFMSVLEYLDDMEVPYNLVPTLVRGLDYYNRTVFEFVAKGDAKRQNALAGGGRYDYLIEELGGTPTPAVGFAMGIDRTVDYVKDNSVKIPKPKPKISAYVIHLGEEAKKIALKTVRDLRKLDVSSSIAVGKDTMKAQMKAADRINARFAVIIGQREAVTGQAIVRDMRDEIQETVDLIDLPERVCELVNERINEEHEFKSKKLKNL